MSTFTRFYSHSGGAGVSTTAITFALTLADASRKVLLIEIGDQESHSAILGIPQFDDHKVVQAAPNLDTLWVFSNASTALADFDQYDDVIVDGGHPLNNGTNYLVTKACYVTLRRAVHQRTPNGVILRAEEGRALTAHDIQAVLSTPIVATVPHDAALCRAIDAGLLIARYPNLASLAEVRQLAVDSLVPVA